MKIGILGGTFDPVHRGHLALARAALKQLRLDCVYLVPARRSPLKQERAASALHRLRMLRRAVESDPRLKISHYELRRPAPSYTVQTLRHFRERFPNAELFFILGSDALSSFTRWRDWREILKLSTLAVAQRTGRRNSRQEGAPRAPVVWLKAYIPAISSTAVRSGRLSDVPPEVRDYIRAYRLYSKT